MEIIEKIGIAATLEQLAEECAELGQASLKLARKIRDENPTPKTKQECYDDFEEEVADVMLVIELLKEKGLFSKMIMDHYMQMKYARWKTRLGISE